MSSKNSNRLKCRQCDIINWATDDYCRRCQQLLKRPSAASESGVSPKSFQVYFYIYVAAIIAPVLVGRADATAGAGLALILMIVGWIIALFFSVSLLVDMFRVSVVWGLAGIFLSPVSTLIFLAKYWDRVKIKFLSGLAAAVYIFIIFIAMNQLVAPEIVRNKTSNSPAPAAVKSSEQTPASKSNFTPPAKNEPKKKP